MGVVEVWQEPSGFWRWRYLEPPQGGREALELVGNDIYQRREDAVESAMTAYPGVTVRERAEPPGAREREPGEGELRPAGRGSGSRGRLLTLLGVAAVLLLWRSRRRNGRGRRDARG